MTDAHPTPRPRDRSRPFDIVLWGATGFTGRLVAEYLLENYGDSDLKLALAGRNRSKLESVQAELAERVPKAKDLPLILGDSHDEGSLRELASRTSVVISTVGPYARHGLPLVAACVQEDTDYCDLTGEVQFMRKTIDEFHERAHRQGTRIVHTCGFDSIPSDLGVFMLQEAMKERHGGHLDEVKLFVGESRGKFSGGTVASMLNLIEEATSSKQTRRILVDPYSLNPEGERSGPDGRDQQGVRFEPSLDMWTGPFVMAAVNTRVVRRSNALMGYPYGRDFRYSESMSFGKGPKGLMRASAVAGLVGGFVTAATVAPLRRLLQEKVLPAPGEGPTREERERGFFVIRLVGRGRDSNGSQVDLRGRVEGKADPGYGETAKMLSESALCLALQGSELDSPGGVRTPASTMGKPLLERLRKAGMVFEVES